MISVCVLSYNRLQFLQQSLESMIETAGEPLEIIIHDDGSNVAVVRWLAEKVTMGEISHLILNPIGHNEGQGTALNRMFHMASGDIIVKADQDLIYKEGWAKAVQDTLEASLDSGNNVSSIPRIGCLGAFRYECDPVDYRKMLIERKFWGKMWWDEVKDFVGSFMAIPREAWEAFGPFPEHSDAFAEDFEFKMRIAEADGWCLALTAHDFIVNQGFGEGPSTVVVRDEQNNLTSRAIHHGPYLVERSES